jgi:hypothetical protein
MSKPNKDRILSNMDKVLFLTKILYDRMSLQDVKIFIIYLNIYF